MSAFEVKSSAIPEIVRKFAYKKRTVRVFTRTMFALTGLHWDGGSRNSYSALRLDDGIVQKAVAAAAPWNEYREGVTFEIPLNVIIVQTGVFKVSRRSALFRRVFRVEPGHRVFRMAPLHHHFEMLGWEQVTVVIRFWIITGLCVMAGMGVFYAEWVAGS